MSARRERAGAASAALAAGLLTFFALESAIARRVGADLFLPVEWGAGVFLPGRLARLAACLVLGFALMMTERGRRLNRALDRFCRRDRGRWIVSAAVTALFFAWTLRVTVLTYMTMDDVSFLQAIAQVPEKGMAALRNTLSHSAQENTSSISVLLCWLIGQFYRLDPDGLWYLGYHLTILLLSITVIGRCLLVKTGRRGWPVWIGCALFGLVCAGVFLYEFAEIAFTVTAALAGSAAVALMLCRHQTTGRAGRVTCDALSTALMVLCFAQRRATGYCLLCFWALAVAYQVLKTCLAGRENRKKRLLALGLCAVMTLALIGGVWAGDRLECDESYRQAEYYRSLVGDYLGNWITYDQYAQAGVPQELANLLYGWYYMDERVTVDLFRQVSDIYYADLAAQPGPSLFSQLVSAIGQFFSAMADDAQQMTCAGCAAVLLLACFAGLLRSGRRYWPELLCALCAAGGASILLLYLVRDGRFLLRAFLAEALPAIVMLLLLAADAPEDTPDGGRTWPRAAGALTALCAVGLTVFCAIGMVNTPHAGQALSREEVFQWQIAVEQYANSRPDTTIISCVYDHDEVNTDPLHAPNTYPPNLVPWGYCGDLAKAPEERLYSGDLLRDDVLFMTDSNFGIAMLLQYLTLDWGPVQAPVVARPAVGLTVCSLEQVSPGADYTGWYEQNGMTYYFRDGQAVTGQQVIDGRTYTFAPAGAQAALTAAPGDAIVYTTDAYSLISTGEDTP